MAVFGLLLVATASLGLPMWLMGWLIIAHVQFAVISLVAFVMYFFNLRTFADWCGEKFREIQ